MYAGYTFIRHLVLCHILLLLPLQLGYDIDGKELDDLFPRFKSVAENKKVN